MWSILSLCLLVLPYIQVNDAVTTNGSSGEPCAVKKCLAGIADCIDTDTCECRLPKVLDKNNGHFGCYRTNSVFGEVFNDPKVRNFNNETANFPFPCRYLLTSVTTNLRVDKRIVGHCSCQLHAFNQKFRGKLFIGGLDYACQIKNTDSNQQVDFSSRVTGLAQNGVYTYNEEGVEAFLPDGPFTPTPVDITGAGVHVKSSVDAVNNQFLFSIPECGWAVTFVAYDIELRLGQEQIPGISFAINCALGPKFHEHDRVIATAPVKFGGTLYRNLPGVPPLTITQALLIRGFTSNVPQTQPDAAPQCSSIGDYLNLCSEENRRVAADRCFWIPDVAKFSRCLNPGNNTEPVVNILDLCVSHHCVGYPTCDELVDIIQATGCANVATIPDQADINSKRICAAES